MDLELLGPCLSRGSKITIIFSLDWAFMIKLVLITYQSKKALKGDVSPPVVVKGQGTY